MVVAKTEKLGPIVRETRFSMDTMTMATVAVTFRVSSSRDPAGGVADFESPFGYYCFWVWMKGVEYHAIDVLPARSVSVPRSSKDAHPKTRDIIAAEPGFKVDTAVQVKR